MQANSSIWFDVSAFPHIVDEIVCEAPPDVLTSFRGVSRRFRAFVDDMTAYHLILEGVSSTILPAAALHNGECILLRSRSDAQHPLGPVWPPHSGLATTRNLDLRGSLHAAALELPLRLDTLRTYEYYAAPPGPHACKTLLWGVPRLPSARRLVLFSTLEHCSHTKYRPQIPRYYPPGVREVVLNFKLPGRGEEWGRLDVPAAPPVLERVTVILTPSWDSPPYGPERLGTPEVAPMRDETDDVPVHRAIADLVAVLARLDAPATLVGWDLLDQRLVDCGVLAQLEEAGVILRRADDMRKEIGEREWDVLTREAPQLSPA